MEDRSHQNIKNRNIIFEYSGKLVFKRCAKPRKAAEKVAMSHYHKPALTKDRKYQLKNITVLKFSLGKVGLFLLL